MNVQNIICRFLWWYMEVSSNHCQSIIFGYFVNISERLLIEWKKRTKKKKRKDKTIRREMLLILSFISVHFPFWYYDRD